MWRQDKVSRHQAIAADTIQSIVEHVDALVRVVPWRVLVHSIRGARLSML
jgi:hypothetical protein